MKTPTTFQCYDCGSTLTGHHTPLCDMAEKGDQKDLPAVKGTQYWTESASGKRRLGEPSSH